MVQCSKRWVQPETRVSSRRVPGRKLNSELVEPNPNEQNFFPRRPEPKSTMLSILARSSPRRLPLPLRSFSSSTATLQAVPTETKPLNKEFKIYRWVPPSLLLSNPRSPLFLLQNPDEPQKSPELQSYTINLNDCGPMVSTLPLSTTLDFDTPPVPRSLMHSSRSRMK